jgi:cytochrome c553
MKFRTSLVAACALALMGLQSTAFAKGDAERGREKSQVCQACHGVDGNGIGDPQYPLLAGQYEDYLAYALRAYQKGDRQNAIMQGFVATLTEQDIEDLAAYYAGQKGQLGDLSHYR